MLTQERYQEILRVIGLKGAATVNEIAEMLDISDSTVRRDLIALDKSGNLKKVRGGAVLPMYKHSAGEDDVKTKELLNIDEKIKIARYAAKQIEDGDFVYIDAGTTTEKMIGFIENKKAIYVTNGIVHAKQMIQRGLKTYIIGGQLKLSTEAIVGAMAVASLKPYNFTKAFMGTNGVSITNGFTTPDSEEALLKQEVFSKSYIIYILADYSKFGRVSSVTFADIESACIITDKQPNSKYSDHTIIKSVNE